MLDSQKIPSVRNEDYGRRIEYKAGPCVGTKADQKISEGGEILEMQIDKAWSNMAREEGHKSKLPSAPSPKEGSAAGGKRSRGKAASGATRDKVIKAVRGMQGKFTCHDISEKINCNKGTVRGWLLKMVASGDIRRVKKRRIGGYEYEVVKRLSV